jgi:hypothetical protein
MKHIKTQKQLNEGRKNLNISGVIQHCCSCGLGLPNYRIKT